MLAYNKEERTLWNRWVKVKLLALAQPDLLREKTALLLGEGGINSGRHEHDDVGSATSSLPARQRAFLDLVTSREFQFGPVKLNKTSPTPARQAHFLVAETIALCALLLHTLFSSVVLFFLFFVFSDSKRGGSTRSDLLIRKLILDVRLKKPDGTEETSFLLGRWTRNLIERVLRILGKVKDVLLTYVATLVGNANLCWSDFQAATDLAVSPNFGGRVALPYVEEGTEIDFSKKSDDAALRLCFEFINYSDIVYGWPQFCKMAIGDSRKIWNLVTQIDVNPQNSVCVGDNYLQLNERAILLMLYHRERQYLLKQKFSVVVSKKVSGFDVGGAPVGAAGTSTGGAASTTSAANRSHSVEVEEVAGVGVDVDHAVEGAQRQHSRVVQLLWNKLRPALKEVVSVTPQILRVLEERPGSDVSNLELLVIVLFSSREYSARGHWLVRFDSS
eukprot:g8701.t1